jgi:nitrogen regulatory protein PII
VSLYLVVLIIDDVENCPAVLDAWEEAGIPGVTILNSTGLGRVRRAGLRDDLPLMPSLSDLFQSDEIKHRTLLSVVDDETMVDRMITIAEEVIGDLDEPHTGFLFVVPVLKVHGMGKHRTNRRNE